MKTPMVSSATSFQRLQTSLQSPMPRLPRSNVYSTRDPANPSASVHRKRFFTPSLTLKFLCAGCLNPGNETVASGSFQDRHSAIHFSISVAADLDGIRCLHSPGIKAIPARRKQKDQHQAGHTIPPSQSGRQASSRRPCCHKESAVASRLQNLAARESTERYRRQL